jgi:replication factor C subunit 2/4
MISFNQLLSDDKYIKDKKGPSLKNKDVIESPVSFGLSDKDKTPWVDKYRPKKLNDIIYQHEIVKILKKTVATGNLPHLLLYGPPGTGKTSSILAMARELFGPVKMKDRVIELNASDERGINVVRNKIGTFARTAIGTVDPKYPCPPYKIIILDEADAMTSEAQSALRKTIESNSNITRFCFICNYINQITDPITSRCVKFRFKPLSEQSMIDKLKLISVNENIKLGNTVVQKIANISNGDMRRAIMLLQNLKYVSSKKISVNNVLDVAGIVPEYIMIRIRDVCIVDKSKDIDKNIKTIIRLAKYIKSEGYSIDSIFNQLNYMIINEDSLDDKMKAKITLHFSKTEKRLIEGADEYLQLLSILMCIRSVILFQDF